MRKNYAVFLWRGLATDFVCVRRQLYDLMKLAKDQLLLILLCGKCIQDTELLGLSTAASDVIIVT